MPSEIGKPTRRARTRGRDPHALPDDARPSFVEAGRRRPQVLADRAARTWGRSGAAQAPALVVEWQPILSAAGAEMIRGGNGVLTLQGLRVDKTSIDMGRVLAGANAVGAGAPPARLPDFRVIGVNPSAGQIDALIAALVQVNYERLKKAGNAPGTMLLTLACWQAVMALVFHHESGVRGGASQFDGRPSGSVRYKTLYFGTQSQMPIFGPPHGYGIGQIDSPAATDDQVWSFVANVDAGVRLLIEAKAAGAYGQLSGHMPNPPDDRFRAVFQRQVVRAYNGGTEFRWENNAWVIRPSLQWAEAADHSKGPHPNLTYPNLVFAAGGPAGVVYYTSKAGAANVADGADTVFPWPITFDAGAFGPQTDQVP